MVRIVGVAALAIVVVVSAFACGESSTAPLPALVSGPPAVGGAWTGKGSDAQGNATFLLNLVQVGSAISGTATTQGDVNDGTCASCHKTTNGTVTGTLTGATLNLTMFFPSGNAGVPTPMCSVTMSVTAVAVTSGIINALYTGNDSCEGPIMNGSFSLAISPAPAPARK